MRYLILLVMLTSCGTIGAMVGTGTSSYETYKTITYAKSGVDAGIDQLQVKKPQMIVCFLE